MYLCKSCGSERIIVCHVLTNFVCEVCKGVFTHHNSGAPKVCNKCAVEKNMCQRCREKVT